MAWCLLAGRLGRLSPGKVTPRGSRCGRGSALLPVPPAPVSLGRVIGSPAWRHVPAGDQHPSCWQGLSSCLSSSPGKGLGGDGDSRAARTGRWTVGACVSLVHTGNISVKPCLLLCVPRDHPRAARAGAAQAWWVSAGGSPRPKTSPSRGFALGPRPSLALLLLQSTRVAPPPSAWLACQGPWGPFQVAFLFKDAGLWAVGLGEMAQDVIIW